MESKYLLAYIRGFVLGVIIVCLVEMGKEYYLSIQHKRYLENLSSAVKLEEMEENTKETDKETLNDIAETDMPETELHEKTIMDKFVELHTENSDLIGWISIPDTVIDYPIMQCKDNEFYLHHDFYKREDRYGCLYVKDIADVNTPGTNFVIYGHNMKDGTMFGVLDKYEDKSFYEKHRQIVFDTLYEERTYEIMSVFLSNANGDAQTGFKYYQFYQADTEEEFAYFYDNIMNMSLYDTGVTAEFGDTFLTMSTCSYHEEDGRIVVVAKKSDDIP